MHDYFYTELSRLFVIALVIILMGLTTGFWALALLFGFIIYAAYQLKQIYYFEEWLQGIKKNEHKLQSIWAYTAQRWRHRQAQVKRRKKKTSRLMRRLYEALETMPNALIILDKHEEVQWFNYNAAQLFGLDLKKRKKIPLRQLLSPDAVAFIRWLRADQMQEFEFNAFILEIRKIKLAAGWQLINIHDISEIKKVQLVRRDFIANVSHELRTPLTVVSGYLEMLLEEEQDPTFLEALQHCQRQTERMQQIVADLLMLSRLEMGEEISQKQWIDVPQLLQELVADARQISQQHPIQLHIESSAGLCGSESELRSAFSNLIYNAVIHTPAQTPIDIYWQASDHELIFQVVDQGPGIAEEHLQRLTERFYRVDKGRSRQRGGTGLGLSIVRHVLKRHQAHLIISSRLQQGSQFKCVFQRRDHQRPCFN